MKVAVMQPYFLPYLGYFQLVEAVDTFVFFDDVNYIMKGWINRNQLFNKSEPLKFTIPLKKPSQNKLINETEISEYAKWKVGFLRQLEFTYAKAPYFNEVFTWISELLHQKEYRLISDLCIDSIEMIAAKLSLNTRFLRSSQLEYRSDELSDGQSKILAICKLLNADTYINPKNGLDLYNRTLFSTNNLQLFFIHMGNIKYKQFGDIFHPFLSMADVLMFNDISTIKDYLSKYQLN